MKHPVDTQIKELFEVQYEIFYHPICFPRVYAKLRQVKQIDCRLNIVKPCLQALSPNPN